MGNDKAPTLTEFLLARVSEREAAANTAWGGDLGVTTDQRDATAALLGNFGPTRVLAECAAKRAIVAAMVDHDAAT